MKNNKVVIALCTNKRPFLLKEAITSLGTIQLPSDYDVEFILVDNDVMQSGKVVFDQAINCLSFPCFYVCEREKGITFARNRALEEAKMKNAKFIAFFDDDAVVQDKWLVNLLSCVGAHDMNIVTGPQLSKFENDSPEWAHKIVYFNQKRHETGTLIRWAATNNILIPMSTYINKEIKFDNFLRYSGGSDQCFSMESRKFDYKIVWCDEAVVCESVPIERTTLKWVFNRSFRYGSTGFFMHKKEGGFFYALFLSLLKASYYFFVGLFNIIFSQPENRLKKINGLCLLGRSAGWLSGIFNKKMNEYANR